MKINTIIPLALSAMLLFSCKEEPKKTEEVSEETVTKEVSNNDFEYVVDQFADIKVLRYQIPGFDALTLKLTH